MRKRRDEYGRRGKIRKDLVKRKQEAGASFPSAAAHKAGGGEYRSGNRGEEDSGWVSGFVFSSYTWDKRGEYSS